MFEVFSLILFAGVCYLLLIGVPSIIEKVTSEEFKNAYMKNLGKTDLHSYGKSFF